MGLYLKAVAAASQEPNSAELQRECRAVQEQLAFVLATAAREAPEALLRFGAASLIHVDSNNSINGEGNSSSCSNSSASCFLRTLTQCLEGGSSASPDSNLVGRQQHALLQLLHQQQQQLHLLLFGSLRSVCGEAAVTSRVPEGTPVPHGIASTTWRCILLLLLLCCYPGGSPTAAAAAAVQAWAHLAAACVCRPESCIDTQQQLDQQQQQLLQQVAQLPIELQQVQEAMRDFTRQNATLEAQLRQRRSQGASSQMLQQPLQQSEELQLLREQQRQRVQGIHLQQAGQQLSLLLPLSPLFYVTSRLLASLKNDDPQHVKVYWCYCCCSC